MIDQQLAKMLNDTIVDLCRELESFWMAEDLEEYREDNMSRIDYVLDVASTVLKAVPEDIRKRKTFQYDRGADIPSGEEEF